LLAFWLRDLELEKYNVVFASAGFLTLASLTQLTDAEAEKLVESKSDRQKLKTGIQEMQEFQFYYLATASLLQELGMERYSQLFALHGISIDVLPFLTEKQLLEMGITSKTDRKKILAAIDKIKHDIPPHSGVWGGEDPSGKSRGGNAGANARKIQPQQPAVVEERSLDELLSFISGDDQQSNKPSSASKKKKRKNRNRNKKSQAAATTSVTVDSVAESIVSKLEISEQQKVEQQHQLQQEEELKTEEDEEDELEEEEEEEEELRVSQEELDPLMKAQVDGEVEEFRRRLEAAGQSSKAKLSPIFYLQDEKIQKKIK
jgi:hypothetical protein